MRSERAPCRARHCRAGRAQRRQRNCCMSLRDRSDKRVPEVVPCMPCRAWHSDCSRLEATDLGVRSNDHGLASIERNEPASALDPRESVRCWRPHWSQSVADRRTFRSGRNFSAWIGLVPKQYTSGGKDEARQHQKTGQPISTQLVRGRGSGRHPLRTRSTEPSIDRGSAANCSGDQRRSRPSRSPTRSQAMAWAMMTGTRDTNKPKRSARRKRDQCAGQMA